MLNYISYKTELFDNIFNPNAKRKHTDEKYIFSNLALLRFNSAKGISSVKSCQFKIHFLYTFNKSTLITSMLLLLFYLETLFYNIVVHILTEVRVQKSVLLT